MIIRSAIVIFICVLSLTAFSQNIYKDTITIEKIEINKKLKKPKIQKIKFRPKKRNSLSSAYGHKYNHYLVKNFPYGTIQGIHLYFNNLNRVSRFDGVKAKNIKFCNKEKHKVEIFEAIDFSEHILIGEKVYENTFLLPVSEKSKSMSSITIDLSHLDMVCDNFFIKVTSDEIIFEEQNCQRQTLGFLGYRNPESLFYTYDDSGNFTQRNGLGLQMDLRVLTREY